MDAEDLSGGATGDTSEHEDRLATIPEDIHRVRKRLASGRVQTYYYAWRCGPRLSGEPGSPEFVVSFQQAHQERRRPVEETLKPTFPRLTAS